MRAMPNPTSMVLSPRSKGAITSAVAAGSGLFLSVREDRTPITTNFGTFIPHSIEDGPLNYERCPVPDIDEIEATLTLENYEDLKADGSALEYIDQVVN